MEYDEEPKICDVCKGPVGIIGQLGSRVHGTCRNCGAWYSWHEEPSTEPKEESLRESSALLPYYEYYGNWHGVHHGYPLPTSPGTVFEYVCGNCRKTYRDLSDAIIHNCTACGSSDVKIKDIE